MQAVQDVLVQGGEAVKPIIKAVVEFTCSMLPKAKTSEPKPDASALLPKGNNGNGARFIHLVLNRNWVRLGGISGALAVALGAYGAHVVMLSDAPEEQKHSFRTANLYHFIGTFGLVAASLSRYPNVSGALMLTGTTIFCGTCYYHGLSGSKAMNRMAPFGGMTLIAGWISMAL